MSVFLSVCHTYLHHHPTLSLLIRIKTETGWEHWRSWRKGARDWPYMTTYRSGPSEHRYPLCHNNVIICWPPFLVNTYSIAEQNWLLVFQFTFRTSFRKFKPGAIILEHQNGIIYALRPWKLWMKTSGQFCYGRLYFTTLPTTLRPNLAFMWGGLDLVVIYGQSLIY